MVSCFYVLNDIADFVWIKKEEALIYAKCLRKLGATKIVLRNNKGVCVYHYTIENTGQG